MSFDFIPRAVKKRKIESRPSTSLPTSARDVQVSTSFLVRVRVAAPTRAQSTNENLGSAHQEGSRTARIQASVPSVLTSTNLTAKPRESTKGPDLEQLAGLVWLSLSDYAIWADVDLRRKIDWNSGIQEGDEDRGGEQVTTNEAPNEAQGYIPLAYLFKHSAVFTQVSSSASFVHYPETIYVKALRTHATQLIDMRLVLSSEEPPFGHGGTRKWSRTSATQTGYEVRVKPHRNVGEKDLSECGKVDWDRLTIYVENMPIQYRSLPGTMKFVTILLSSALPSPTPHTKIQNIAFPSHHRDQLNSAPTCKGFALVTLSNPKDVKTLLEKWPWDTAATKAYSKAQELDASYPQALQDAMKFGFRTISKERWEGLKAEYLIFRQQLVEEINEFQENEQANRRQAKRTLSIPKPGPSSEGFKDREQTRIPTKASDTSGEAAFRTFKIHAASSYPLGCLVFVRHLHSETNKTTLRSLFGRAWKSEKDTSSSSKFNDGIDYLDYMRGTDSCHIRLSTPLHAQQFVEYFSARPTMQALGLDGVGSSPQNSSSPIKAELVLGKREEVYWEKVPEKIRSQAVDKALKLMNNGAEGGGEGHASTVNPTERHQKR